MAVMPMTKKKNRATAIDRVTRAGPAELAGQAIEKVKEMARGGVGASGFERPLRADVCGSLERPRRAPRPSRRSDMEDRAIGRLLRQHRRAATLTLRTNGTTLTTPANAAGLCRFEGI